jgi:hypothetical protein
MTITEERALDLLIGRTACLTDRHRQYAALLYARARNIEPEMRQVFLARRFSWLDWQSVTQREWQIKTRNPNKARHHDSISLREKYVRC